MDQRKENKVMNVVSVPYLSELRMIRKLNKLRELLWV